MSNEFRLHYNNSAETFPNSLPLGNGRLAASVLSTPRKESFLLNEVTFWSGAPESAGSGLTSRPADPKAELRKTQQCFLDGDFAQGEERAKEYLEAKKGNFGTNLAVGRLNIAVGGQEGVNEVRRELNLEGAMADTLYIKDGHRFSRSSFISHPHNVLVVTFDTTDPRGQDLLISMQGEGKAFRSKVEDGRLHFDAQALETVHSGGACGVKGHGVIAVKSLSGKAERRDNDILAVSGGKIIIFLAFTTDYQKSGDEWKGESSRQIDEVLKTSMEDIRAAHHSTYEALYKRTSLTLGRDSGRQSELPTDQRRQNLKPFTYANDPGMFELYFNYARYLTIAGTRADSPLPLHLQGLWNDGEACRMGWSCDYHLDINTQMNYFPTMTSGLSDLMKPMVSYLESLAVAGRDAARACYGCDGWVAHVFSNAWGFADPGWEISYGLNVTGGLWMASHLIELYEYTLDETFLKDTAYPILKGAATFFLDYMVEDPKTGWLHTGPSVSPENSFFVMVEGKGKEEHCLHLSPTLDVVLVRDLFDFCVYGTKLLGIDSAFAERVGAARAKLPPFQIGKHGQLQEWLQDFDEAQPFHRHLSHTMALCRSAQISTRHSPELARAIGVALDRRQHCDELEDIEFTAALFGLNYARLGEADKALDKIGHLVNELSFDNLLSFSKPGVAGAEQNISVVDGNFGGAAVIVEMLVRSLMPKLDGPVEVDLLPALPTAWPEGKAKGFRLRGNLEIDLEWSEGKLDKATIRTFSPGYVAVYYGDHCHKTPYQANDLIELGPSLEVLR